MIQLELQINYNDIDETTMLTRVWGGPLLPVGTEFFLSQKADCMREAKVTSYQANIYTPGDVSMICDLVLNKEDYTRMQEIITELCADGWVNETDEQE